MLLPGSWDSIISTAHLRSLSPNLNCLAFVRYWRVDVPVKYSSLPQNKHYGSERHSVVSSQFHSSLHRPPTFRWFSFKGFQMSFQWKVTFSFSLITYFRISSPCRAALWRSGAWLLSRVPPRGLRRHESYPLRVISFPGLLKSQCL